MFWKYLKLLYLFGFLNQNLISNEWYSFECFIRFGRHLKLTLYAIYSSNIQTARNDFNGIEKSFMYINIIFNVRLELLEMCIV